MNRPQQCEVIRSRSPEIDDLDWVITLLARWQVALSDCCGAMRHWTAVSFVVSARQLGTVNIDQDLQQMLSAINLQRVPVAPWAPRETPRSTRAITKSYTPLVYSSHIRMRPRSRTRDTCCRMMNLFANLPHLSFMHAAEKSDDLRELAGRETSPLHLGLRMRPR